MYVVQDLHSCSHWHLSLVQFGVRREATESFGLAAPGWGVFVYVLHMQRPSVLSEPHRHFASQIKFPITPLPLICYFYCESFSSFLIVQIFAYMYPRSFAPVLFGSSSMPFCILVPFPWFFFFFLTRDYVLFIPEVGRVSLTWL